MKGQQTHSKKLVYRTPGRECAHGDRGCCPTCLDPLDPRNRGTKFGKVIFSTPRRKQAVVR